MNDHQPGRRAALAHPDHQPAAGTVNEELQHVPLDARDLPIGPGWVARTTVGGLLMGIANLIPGVSGGTMILALGLYEEFIDAVADTTALRLRWRRIVFLGLIATAAAVAILALAGVIMYLLLWYAPVMFALFIGLTLGGAPLLMRMIRRPTTGVIVAVVAGLVFMAGLAAVRQSAAMPRNTVMDFASGVVGATTMVLPGISGSYVLLILDQYDRIVGAVDDLKTTPAAALRIIVPVGIGAVLGIIGLSNLLKFLLHRAEKVTLGFLLGMLLGSVLGLWPFDRAPTPKILEKRPVAELRDYLQAQGLPPLPAATPLEHPQVIDHILAGWPQRLADPYAPGTVSAVIVAMLAGFAATTLLSSLGARSVSAQTTRDDRHPR